MSSTSKGKAAEKRAIADLEAAGYAVTKSHLSRGEADLIAIGHQGLRLIQVKILNASTHMKVGIGAMREAFEALPLPPNTTCELWVSRKVKGRYQWVRQEVLVKT